MSRARAWFVGLALGAVVAPAYADDAADCVRRDSPRPDGPSHVLFGNGNGYTAQVVVADIAAMTTTALVLSISWAASTDKTFTLTSLVATPLLVVLTGPIVHFVHGRPIFGLVSLLGWASLAATAEGLGAAFSMSSSASDCCGGGSNNTVRGGMVALGISAGGGALMTLLDGWMARSVHAPASSPKPKAIVTPSMWTTAGGAGAGVAGTF